MESMSLTYEEFVVEGQPDVMATLELEVEYEWEPYNPGNWHDEPPSGGGPDYWEVKVKSAKLFDFNGTETKANEEQLKALNEQVEKDSKLQDWVGEQIQAKGESEPE